MVWMGAGLVFLAAVLFILMRRRNGLSKFGNRPLFEAMVAAAITGLTAIGIVMMVAALVKA